MKKSHKRIAIIDRSLCLGARCGYVCMKVCPGVKMGDKTVWIDNEGFPVISEVLCTGCGICPKKCPVDCIDIINLPSETGTLIHQYGVNSFRLYNLPIPQAGVCGIIGKNGIGKSTAIKIMSGKLSPNFGNLSQNDEEKGLPPDLPLAIKNYFLDKRAKQLVVSYKPQNIDKIPDVVSGKVNEILKRIDERGNFEDVVRRFSLQDILEREIKNLSGGELQRLALAASLLKDADIYYFDEPSSYLDIEQRIAISVAIREVGETKNVMVVEHDLAVLDYLCDYVYIFWGHENGYGVVSSLKSARRGINEYLSGVLRDENVRFRENEIRFSFGSESERKASVKLAYPQFQKKYPGFVFSSEAGEIMEGEIVGVVGKNALGKTLFAKLICGIEKPDEKYGDLPRVSLSYKPQYLSADAKMTVSEFFSSQKLNAQFFEECKRRLGIERLMLRKLTQLSGGELQRVAITSCLSKEAELYLLDEPSAFLDIEQRLQFSELIRSLIVNSSSSALVIDHDVVLIDSLASRIIVFDGRSSVYGHASSPQSKINGMNSFLKSMGITMRRDVDTLRPRINKPDSIMDRKQKEAGQYFYYKSKK
ncbi:MAG: ribosome biogenesis/translation initiation ATPase RLI [Candidatus Anstonellales archaeon]